MLWTNCVKSQQTLTYSVINYFFEKLPSFCENIYSNESYVDVYDFSYSCHIQLHGFK